MIAVVVAAGRGRRLGNVAKALLPTAAGPSFLATIAGTANCAGVSRVIVVIAEPFASEVGQEADRLAIETVLNEAPERGMASSIALGFERAALTEPPGGASSALLWPVDHPFPAPSTVVRLRRALGNACAAIPTHRGRGGHPVVVARRLWAELAACHQLDQGARSVLRAPGRHVVRVEVGSAAVLRDVDVPADLPASPRSSL